MLKTNSKKVSERVNRYIIESMEASSDHYNPTEKELLAAALDWYYSGEAYTEKYYNSTYYTYKISLAEFMTNSAIIFTPWYEEQRQIIKGWLEETEEEAQAYTDKKVSKLFYALLNRELNKLIDKNNLSIIRNDSQLKKNAEALTGLC